MRLIEADTLKDSVEHSLNTGRETFSAEIIYEAIDNQPTAYDVDKVVAELEKEKQKHKRLIEYEKKNGTMTEESDQRKSVEVLEKAIQIVKGGGVYGD